MNLDDIILEKIDRYTRGMMDGEERVSFEKEIAYNERLQRKIELSMIVDQMVVAKEALKLKEQMRKDLYKSKPNWGVYLGMALVGIAAGGGVFWAYHQTQKGGNEAKPQVHTAEITTKTSPNESTLAVPTSKEAEVNPKTAPVVKDPIAKAPLVAQVSPQGLVKKEEKAIPKEERIQNPKEIHEVVEKRENASNPVQSINPCVGLQGDVDFSVLPSCKGEETGAVYIRTETVKGGTAPYTFSLGTRQSTSSFDHLASGQYDLWIKDAQDCRVEHKQKVFVPEKNCKTPQQYVFNPDYDHAWTIPYDRDKKPTRVVIQEKGGRVFYQSSVNDFIPAEWTGDSNTGLALSFGLYFLTIEYADSSIDEATVMVTK
jgi:hypothetical protein